MIPLETSGTGTEIERICSVSCLVEAYELDFRSNVVLIQLKQEKEGKTGKREKHGTTLRHAYPGSLLSCATWSDVRKRQDTCNPVNDTPK
jgi:hypothetical protein